LGRSRRHPAISSHSVPSICERSRLHIRLAGLDAFRLAKVSLWEDVAWPCLSLMILDAQMSSRDATQEGDPSRRTKRMPSDSVTCGDRETISIVIVTFQSLRLVDDCLKSLMAHGPKLLDASVHVVDNASSDGTIAHIRAHFPWVNIYPRSTNDGFSVANNAALREIRDDFVLILNPDTRFESNAIDPLYERLRADASVGMIGCRLLQEDGTFDHAAKRTFPSPTSAMTHALPSRLGISSTYTAPDVAETGSGYVDAINGAFMFIKREALDAVGLFDEAYWMYGEDLDLAKRFQLASWRVWYEGSVSVRHVKGGVSGKWRRTGLNYQFHKSMAIYYRKFHSGRSVIVDTTVYVGIAVKFFVSAIISVSRRRIPLLAPVASSGSSRKDEIY
jgi:N-acetylglucosaminyl-diphospho-decaprenol L-rhamnosyltransferase